MANIQMLQQTANQFATDQGKYQKAVNQFNFDADVYNKQLKEYQGIVDAYNNNPAVLAYDAAVKNYNSNLIPAYQTQVSTYNTKADFWNNGKITFTLPLIGDRQLSPAAAYKAVMDRAANTQSQADRDYQLGRANDLKKSYYPGAAPTAPVAPTNPNIEKPGDFTAVKPELTAVAPNDPGFTKGQLDALSGKQSVAQQERSKDSGLVAGAQAALQDARSESSMIGGLLARARYST